MYVRYVIEFIYVEIMGKKMQLLWGRRVGEFSDTRACARPLHAGAANTTALLVICGWLCLLCAVYIYASMVAFHRRLSHDPAGYSIVLVIHITFDYILVWITLCKQSTIFFFFAFLFDVLLLYLDGLVYISVYVFNYFIMCKVRNKFVYLNFIFTVFYIL